MDDFSSKSYGKPIEGSKTQLRGLKAYDHITREVQEMCNFIKDHGIHEKDGTFSIKFGHLFEVCIVN